MTKMTKSYSELIKIPTFKERYEYLKCNNSIGQDTFGMLRFFNQDLYRSKTWKTLRNRIIARDNGYDMALQDYICDKIVIHHINPITVEDFECNSSIVYDPENLVCVDFYTHQAIHYGNFESIRPSEPTIRKPYDTCPWR